ncbi:DUF427 domain-containing protein [Nocardia jejuensis]|uniref:DUF427 domain-containing protein n=1 Tax=Nocardia jejuensis TaxID=328049 RepID=UPI000829C657|nr:DUF427 domain-containing protein [Nocardia jejuensis]
MNARPVLQPGADHPITVEPNPSRITVRVNGRVVADTRRAQTVREASYPPVHYIPLADVDQQLLERTETSTYCPYKGDASYYSIVVDGDRRADAIWSYESPYPAVAEIANHLAFYPSRVDEITEQAAVS